MGKVFISGIVPQKTAPVTFKSNFADNDWSTIIKACQTNKVPDTWTVGSQKTMTINGTDYAIDIIGKNHDDYADGSGKAPLTFQFHDLVSDSGAVQMNYSSNSNVGGWRDCLARTTHLPSILTKMPVEVQDGIRKVSKLTAAGNGSSTIDTTEDDLFLLAEIEVFNSTSYSKTGEGNQYAYYAEGNSPIKYVNKTTKQIWWLRSPYNSSGFATGHSSGKASGGNSTTSYYLAPAFCF